MKRLMACLVVAGALAFGGLAAAKDNPKGDKPPTTIKLPDGPAQAGITFTDGPPTPVTLPETTAAALAKAFPNATVKPLMAYDKESVKLYVVELAAGEKKFQVHISESGAIISIGGRVAAADLPKPVTDAVANAADGATIQSAFRREERADKDLKPLDKPDVRYALALAKGNSRGAMIVAEDGAVKMGPRMVALPAAAAAAIARALPKATLETIQAFGPEGDKAYSVTMVEGEKGENKFHLSVSESGVITAMVGPVAPADLPKPVADAVAKAFEGATITNAIKIEKRLEKRFMPLDKPETKYQLTISRGDACVTLIVAEDGTVEQMNMFPAPKPAKEKATDTAPK